MEEHPKPKKDREPRFKWWLCTWNNPPEDWRGALDKLQADYAIGQLEKGKNGTIHIQFTLYFRNSITGERFKKLPFWHAGKPANAGRDLSAYTSKSDTRIDGPYEMGSKPSLPGDANALLDACFELAKEGRFDEIPGHIKLKYWTQLSKIRDHYDEAPFRDTAKNLWLYGPSDHGKTYWVEHHPKYQGAYQKNNSKWWPGYRGQETVVFNDVGPTSAYFISEFKVLVDTGRVWVESKGTNIPLKASKFVVTSNYSMDDFLRLAGLEMERGAANKRFFEMYKFHYAYPKTGIPIVDGGTSKTVVYNYPGDRRVELPASEYLNFVERKFYNQ